MEYIATVTGAAGDDEIVGVFSTFNLALSAALGTSVVDCQSRSVWELSADTSGRATANDKLLRALMVEGNIVWTVR